MEIELTYAASKPCRRGHEPIRYIKSKQCRACALLTSTAYNQTIPDLLRERIQHSHHKFYRTPKGMITRLFRNAQNRAQESGVPFALVREDIVIPTHCPVLGIPLSIGLGRPHDGSPSLDRLIPILGYIRGNVAVISHRANTLKNSGTVAELRLIADWMERQLWKSN